MRGLNTGAGIEYFDPAWSQGTKNALSCLIHKPAITAIEGFKMPEEQDELLQMQIRELSIHAVEWMGYGMSDVLGKKILLQIVNTLPRLLDFPMLQLGDSPHEYVHTALILRENSGYLFADDDIRQVRDLQAAIDSILIGERHKAHPGRPELAVEFKGI
jgi:hypothetical protein